MQVVGMTISDQRRCGLHSLQDCQTNRSLNATIHSHHKIDGVSLVEGKCEGEKREEHLEVWTSARADLEGP